MSKKTPYQLRRWLPFGICSVAISPIRKRPSDREEIISQLLFGECVEVLERKLNWVRIRCAYDDYIGWIDRKQIINISEPEFKKWSNTATCSLELVHSINNNRNIVPILLGSSLPEFDGLHFRMPGSKYIFNGKVTSPIQTMEKIDIVKRIAKMYLHAPYLWGGRSVFGIDCSGFTQMVYKLIGIKLPRDAYQQVGHGEIIDFVPQVQVGDLVFFHNKDKRVHHVGIALSNDSIIHASGKVRIDKLDHFGIYNAEMKKYTHELKVIKRLLPTRDHFENQLDLSSKGLE